MVCTREEQEVLNRGSRKSEALMKKLTAMDKAEQHKNTLLEYDRTSEKRTQVIDDESDYFSVDSEKWLNSEQRKKLKEHEKKLWEQKHGSRLNKKYNFDFAGRKIVEETVDLDSYNPEKDETLKSIFQAKLMIKENDSTVANPGVFRPTYANEKSKEKSVTTTNMTSER